MPPTLLSRYRAIIARQRERTTAAVTALWAALPDYDTPDLFAVRALPILAGAQSSTIAVSSAFYAVAMRTPPVGVTPDMVGVQPKIRDPYLAHWHALNMGRPWEEAVEAGTSAVDGMTSTFLQSTARRTGDAVAVATGRTPRWRRVAEPNACDWCRSRDGGLYLSAADGDYGHVRCHCVVIPEIPA